MIKVKKVNRIVTCEKDGKTYEGRDFAEAIKKMVNSGVIVGRK